jgi:selenide,water dikinase
MQMAQASHVDFEIFIDQVPFFKEAILTLEAGSLTKAHRTNRQYVEAQVVWEQLSELQKLLLVDPQTSGGLLLSVKASAAESLLGTLLEKFPASRIIGRVLPTVSGAASQIRVL